MNQKAEALHKKARPAAKRSAHSAPEEETPALWAKHLGKSLLATFCFGVVFTLAGALCAYFYPDPDRLIMPLSLCASALTALCGGFVTVKIHGHSALLCGLLNGTLFTVLMLAASLFFRTHASGYSAGISCLLHTGFLLCSVAGAYLGLKKRKKKTKKR